MDFKGKIVSFLQKETKLENVESLLSIPPQGMGDYSFPCFVLAKEQKKNPFIVAQELSKIFSAQKISFIEKVEAKGPYVNFFVKKEALSESILEKVFLEKLVEKIKKEKIMVEYSGPNTNKPLHIGHLRNNSLGLAISNLFEEVGCKVIKANIVNDRGIHICKSMLAYKLFAKGKTPESEKKKSDHFVGDMYVLFAKELEKDPSLEEKAKEMLIKWEEGDKETIALWKKMNKWALDGMKETYKDFGSKFDEWFIESDFFRRKEGQKIVEEGLKKKIFRKEDNGAVMAVLEPDLPNKVIMRGDGTTLYATNDLGVTQYRFDNFDIDGCIWVVGSEQELYFRQLFKMFELLGRKWAKKCYHLSYGMVNLTSGKIKSREGIIVDADDLLAEMKTMALDELEQRYPDLSAKEKEKRAKAIALAAIKFYLLKNDAKKDMLFDPKQSISFEGETGPYVQYTYARAKSILRKAKEEKISYKRQGFDLLVHEKEKELINALAGFSDSINKSKENLSLHPLCHNLLTITEKFNSYYHEVPIIKSDNKKLINARLALVEATTLVLKKGLEILDIEAINEM